MIRSKIFVSYSHKQVDWVRNRLIPCLRSGGIEIDLDYERFKAGVAIVGQMDKAQDEARATLLVLTDDYLKSDYCLHEMRRAFARDPHFSKGSTIPVKRDECEMPEEIKAAEPLIVDLSKDNNPDQWDRLLNACGAGLGIDAPGWLSARDEILKLLTRHQSINLVVTGNPKWREMIKHLRANHIPDLGVVDLAKGSTASRSGLVSEILKVCRVHESVPEPPNDLGILDRALSAREQSIVALLHFDLAKDRQNEYGIDLFAALRYLIMDSRKLVLLIQSRRAFIELLPHDHPLSAIDIKTVELRGR